MKFNALFKRKRLAYASNKAVLIVNLILLWIKGTNQRKLIMRTNLTIILMATMLQVSAAGYAQNISLKKTQAPLREVIKEIRKQSGYDFVYTSPQMNLSKPVTINVSETPLQKVLELCFENQPLTYAIEDKTIIVKNKPREVIVVRDQEVVQRAVVVRGTIVGENGAPISGASIKIKGAVSRGISSSRDGLFTLPVPNNSIIQISYVGYKLQEVKIQTTQPLFNVRVVMVQEDKQMDEVVISTGIFKKADKSFTGASTTVTAKELKEFGNRNLITSLRNIDPSFNIIESNSFGSNPNRMPEIQIRGNSSIPNVGDLQNESRVDLNTPLIILDGFQSSLQKLLDINENDVESITILKDAAATAIYGSRGSNGVVVIITKSPKAGKLRLTFSTNLNVEDPDLSDYNLLKSKDKLELERRAGYFDNVRAEQDLVLKRYYNYLLNEVNKGVETDWMAIPLRTGVGQRHNLRLEGGDQAFRYSASAQMNNIQGVMKGSSRNTFNGDITLSYIYKSVRFRNNLQIQEGKSNESPYGIFSDYAEMNPYWNPYGKNGEVLKLLGDPGNTDYVYTWNTLPTNPLYNATLRTVNKSAISEIINNTSVEWTIMDGMLLRGQLGLTKGSTQTDKFRPADHTDFANYSVDDVFRKGDYNYGISNRFSYDGSLNLSYSKTFNNDHVLFAGVDYNIRQNKYSTYGFKAEGFPNANFDFVSMALQYAKDGSPSGSEGLTRAIGLTSNVNYIFKDKYFVDATIRVDGASQFGSKRRFAPFWSTGAGWNLHRENFLKDNDFINRLKIRGSMGITGSQNFSAYQAMSTYRYFTDDRYFNWIGADLISLGNEELKWQQAMKYNVGADAEFLKRRLKLTADYYVETTNGLVSSVNLPASNGFGYYTANIGRMRNKGYELKATGFLLTNPEKLIWSVTASVLHNSNKVLETSQALKDAQKVTQNDASDPGILYMEGYSSKAIWVVPSIGIDPSTGKELFLDVNGLPTYTWNANNIRAVGSTEPDIFGNFSSMVRYKNFSLNASFRYTFGGQQYNRTLVDKVETGNYDYNVDARVFTNRWQQPGDIAAFKGLLVTGATQKTSRFVQDENTLICQNINFQYDLRAKNVLQKLGLEALNLSADIADPMYLSSIRRERGTSYPFSKQFSFKIQATF